MNNSALIASRTATLILILSLSNVTTPAFAHGDEDHSQKPAATKNTEKTKASAAKATGLVPDATTAQRLSDGSLFVPKAVQRQLALRTTLSEVKQLATTLELNGKIVADPNAGGRVQASQAGRVEPGPQGLPGLGQRVNKGQVLAYLRPVMSSVDRGNSQSILADIESQLSIAERKVQRYEQLEAALPRATIEAARFEYDALKKRRIAVEASLQKTEALVAPVSGTISVANAVTGQVVDAKETLFEIIDPSRLMVEALAYDPVLTTNIGSAFAAVNVRKEAETSSGAGLALKFVGGGQQMREQAIPLLFRVMTKDAVVAVGQSVKVIVQTTSTVEGVAVPNAAVMRVGAGEMAVWVHTDAERFVQRKVRAQVLDAGHVSLIAGVKSDERIVTTGASLLAQVR